MASQEQSKQSVQLPWRQCQGASRARKTTGTNPSEGNNKLVQDFVHEDTRKTRVSEFEFAQSLRKLVQRRENDLEMAVINQGPYRVREAFKHIVTTPDDWIKMTSDQRKRALKKVHDTNISDARDSSLTEKLQPTESTSNPILHRLLQEGIHWIPLSTFTGMTQKAEKILQDPGRVISIPNSEGSILVPSTSDARNPHIVYSYSTGRIVCNCTNNKSLSICSHSIVYAEHQRVQPKFYNWLKKLRRTQGSNAINLSNLLSADMPRGRGRKGERPPRTAKGKSTHTTTGGTASASTSQKQTQTHVHQQPGTGTQINQQTSLQHSQLQIRDLQPPNIVLQQQLVVQRQQLASGSLPLAASPQQQVAGQQQMAAYPQQQIVGLQQQAAGSQQLTVGPHQLSVGPQLQLLDPQQQVADKDQLAAVLQQQALEQRHQVVGFQQQATGVELQAEVPLQQVAIPKQLAFGPHQPTNQQSVLLWSDQQEKQVNQQPYVFSQPYHNRNPFVLELRHGNIRKCTGCGGEISKQASAPDDMILKHMERYKYPTGSPLQPFMYTVSKEKAHYYHARTACVISRHPYFTPELVDLGKVRNQLSEQHKLRLVMDLDIFLA